MSQNSAAWIKSAGGPIEVGPADMPQARDGEMVIKVEAIAFHPLDAKLSKFDFLHLPTYPAVFGASLGGTLVELGPNTSGFAVGDRVIASNPTYFAPFNAEIARYGAFQRFAAVRADTTAKLTPDGLPLAEAITIPTQASVAATALGVDAKPAAGGTVLVWGAGSAVGGYAVQYAARVGHTVVATAAASDHERVRRLGAAHVYDYRAERDALTASLRAHGPYAGVLDCIGTVDTLTVEVGLFDKPGVIYSMVPPPPQVVPEHVQVKYRAYVGSIFDSEKNGAFVKDLWGSWIKDGVQNKTIVPQAAAVTRGGLDKVQECLNMVGTTKRAQVVLLLDE